MQETGLAHGRLLDTDAVESPTFDHATGRSSAWLERWLWGPEVAGSNPAAPTPPAGVALLQHSRQEGAGMYVSIRTYRVANSDGSPAMLPRGDRDLAESFAQEPGFVSYQVARTGEHTVASMTTFRTREQAEASNDLAAEWVAEALADLRRPRAEGVADFGVERMGVMGGEVHVSRANADMLEPAHA